MPKVTVISLPEELLQTPKNTVKPDPVKKRTFLGYFLSGLGSLLGPFLHKENILLNLMAFLLGRVSVMGEVTSIGLAFFGALAQTNKQRALAAGIWGIFGVITNGFYTDACVYAFAILTYLYWENRLTRFHRKILAVPLLLFCSVLVGGLAALLYSGITVYNSMVVFFNASICLVLSGVFLFGMPLLLGKPLGKSSSEGVVCMLVMLATAVTGLGDWAVAMFSLRTLFGNLLIMAVASIGGAGLGAASGIAVGLIAGLSTGNAAFAVSVCGVSGLLSGMFRNLGKGAVILGFLVGRIWIFMYFGQVASFIQGILESAGAGLVFALIPQRIFRNWQEQLREKEPVMAKPGLSVQEIMVKIRQIGEAFQEAAAAFSSSALKVEEKGQEEQLAKVLRTVGEQVCERCEKRTECWETDFYRTYQGMLTLLQQAQTQKTQEISFPQGLKDNCIHLQEVLERIMAVAERSSLQQHCQKKLVQQRYMVSEQMKAAGRIMDELVFELNKEQMEDQEAGVLLQERAALLDCPLSAVKVKGSKDAITLEACKHPCNGNKECKNTLLPLAAAIMQEKLTLYAQCGDGQRKKECHLTMQVARRFSVEKGFASLPKEGQSVCGDTASVTNLNKGKVSVLLSDGMGSSSSAAGQSTFAVRLLEKLLTAGFDMEVAVKTVNSMLLLQTTEESFVTVDMAVIDTYSGEADFLKIGAAPSFIKRVREVQVIQASSLPMGILQQIEIKPVQAQLAAGDYLIMVSDGIADILVQGREKESWLPNYLRRSRHTQPQQLAEDILSQAMILSGKKAQDDMTVLVVKITERPNLV